MAKCAYRRSYASYLGELDKLPPDCPTKVMAEVLEEARRTYSRDDEVRRMALASSEVEGEGYMRWPRLVEVAELAKKLGIRKIGIAFCIGLREEAGAISRYLEKRGFQVSSVCCKVGAIPKSELGLPRDLWVAKDRPFEAICNPIGQALVLNALGTELNLAVGLCVGHDSLFYRYSKAPVVTLIAKDRVTGHNPAMVLYSGYYRRALGIP